MDSTQDAAAKISLNSLLPQKIGQNMQEVNGLTMTAAGVRAAMMTHQRSGVLA